MTDNAFTQMDAAEYLVALWCIGKEDARSLCDALGIIDQSLFDMFLQFPVLVRRHLSFSNTAVGLRCNEWPAMVQYLEEAACVTRDGDSCTSLTVQLSSQEAREILHRLTPLSQQRLLAKNF